MNDTTSHVILLAEDEQALRELIETVLQASGYVVHAAADGRAALRLLAEHRVDLIITDLCMPGTDGMQFLMALRQARSGVPVIVMSGGVGSNMAGMLRAAQLMGARHTLAKPFALPNLVQTVREVLPAAAR
jgi:two-component system, OmpR family, response regulator